MNPVLNTPVVEHYTVPKTADILAQSPQLLPDERVDLIAHVKQLLIKQNAVLVAHYYVDAELQQLAEETGGYVSDSLDMARFGHEHKATTLVVAGVRFMGETAKILNPEKRVLMPELNAECSLDLGCPADAFTEFCDAHPDRTVVVYANTSAEVKARADWMVTSGISVPIVEYLTSLGEKIIWAPDKHLGAYVESVTGADMLIWPGHCVVHDEFRGKELARLMQDYPGAEVLVHPESPANVINMASTVGSTSALINAARHSQSDTLIVATDKGILYQMKQAAPNKNFIEAPTGGIGATCTSCAHCPWMAMNQLQNLASTLETGSNEIFVDQVISAKAIVPIKRMLDFAKHEHKQVLGKGRA